MQPKECDACGCVAQLTFPRIIFVGRKPGKTWGGKQQIVGYTCFTCKMDKRPAKEVK
jgi:hypothetical protein